MMDISNVFAPDFWANIGFLPIFIESSNEGTAWIDIAQTVSSICQTILAAVAGIYAWKAWNASCEANKIAHSDLQISQNQQKVENAVRLVDEYQKHILETKFHRNGSTVLGHEIEKKIISSLVYFDKYTTWAGNQKNIHYLIAGYSKTENKTKYYHSIIFSQGLDDNFMAKSCEYFNLISHGLLENTVDFETINFHLGSIILAVFFIKISNKRSYTRFSKNFPDYCKFWLSQSAENFNASGVRVKNNFKADKLDIVQFPEEDELVADAHLWPLF
jgi:hypothetical protein